MKVPVMTATARTVPIYRSFPATTEAMRSVPIQARVTGYLAQQGAIDGADVAAGALLYWVDSRDYQAALAQATGQRDRSVAGLSYSRVKLTRFGGAVQAFNRRLHNAEDTPAVFT